LEAWIGSMAFETHIFGGSRLEYLDVNAANVSFYNHTFRRNCEAVCGNAVGASRRLMYDLSILFS
jgi:hypothetical protein